MMGRELRMARPSGYVPPAGGDPSTNAAAGISATPNPAMGLAALMGQAGGGVVDNVKARKLYVGNLPLEMSIQESTMKVRLHRHPTPHMPTTRADACMIR